MTTRLILSAAALLSSPYHVAAQETDSAELFAESNILSVFYHEFAHGIIDIVGLPVFGQEEDSADVLSVVLVNEFYEEETAVEIIKDAAALFDLDAKARAARGKEFPYWDTHGPDAQRYFNTICLFYGANPAARGDMAQLLGLPDDRATRCEEEFGLAYDSWGAVLDDLAENGGGDSIQMIAPASGVSEAGQWMADILDAEIAALNDEFTLPDTLNVTVGSCGESNAFYDPTQGSIVMCTELVEDLLARFDATLAAGKPARSPAPAPTGSSLGQAEEGTEPTITIAPNAKGRGAGNDF